MTPSTAEPLEPQRWRPWDRVDGGYAELARYVSPEAVRGLELAVGDQAGDDEPAVARRLYLRLQQRLREGGVEYAREPRLTVAGAQEIRHPDLILRDRVATCIDVATTYAAMCLRAHVGVLLAITYDHAYVILTPGRLPVGEHVQTPFSAPGLNEIEGEHAGVSRGEAGALLPLLDSGTAVAIDCVSALTSHDFDTALAAGRSRAERLAGRLVDVDYLHGMGFEPFAPPADRPSIHLHVAADDSPFDDYPNHRATIEALRGAGGTVVLLAPQGRGKSRIARRLAQKAPVGAGWFLDASSPQTLANSLAEADRAEQDLEASGLARLDRAGFAHSALARLAEMRDPWVVVLDNADGDPGKLAGLMPAPRAGQLLLVTSTNDAWRGVPGAAIRELPAVDDEEIARRAGPELVEPIAGRPLLLSAFERFMAATGADAAAVVSHAPPGAEGEGPDGPATLWAALRAAGGFGERELLVSACAAYLPPDHQPLTVLETLVPGARAAARHLADRGLLSFELQAVREDDDRAAVRIHRLFARAVRDDLEARRPELAGDLVRRLVREQAPYELLDARGDLDTVTRLEGLIVAADVPGGEADPELGLALHGVAKLLELHAQTRRSGEVFGRAKRHLQGVHPVEYADCLQGQARTVNQHQTGDELALRQAVGWAREARATIVASQGENANADRALAMEGLLMQKLSKFPGPGETRLQLLEQALDVIEEANRRRLERDDVEEAELARSQFNLAGPRIELAQQEPQRAAEHLDKAAEVYEQVRVWRMRLYQNRTIHPHIAACIHGLGLVDYYRALLVATSKEQRSAFLRDATDHVVDGLKQRETLEGSIDLDEVAKSAALLAKIALARQASPAAHVSIPEATFANAVRELTKARVVLAPVAPLPSERAALPAAIEAWARSPALALLVEEFGGTVPQGELGDVLAWLEAFSEVWDSRGGKERNLVVAPQFAPATEKLVAAAAKALGLDGAGPPKRGGADGEQAPRYDHVLILGGLVRACLARPLHAAKLLRDGAIAAGDVTALGGFREIAGDEVGLIERVTGEAVGDEFHAMDAGVRNAFGVAAPVSERGEDSGVVGASWRVREYATDGGLAVRVVAAPSTEPGERRANTPDTYLWFATELAKLAPGQRILVVTTDIYVPYQHADAIRMLALPYGVTVETAGMQPGKADARLRQPFATHNYLQEIRSAIRALRALHAAL